MVILKAYTRYFFAAALVVLGFSCAQMQVPGGGPKDTFPPKAVKYIPDSAAVNSNPKVIRIFFDEYIQLKDVQGQVIISPPMKTTPEIRLVKNKIVEVEFKETLKLNTTYTIFFGSAIADIHEGTVAQDFRYFFSTGSFIDSLQIAGSVMDALSLKGEKGMTVILHSNLNDSAPRKVLPDYFARTGADGSFSLTHLRPGKYKIYALRDANNNFLYDSDEEVFAFHDSVIDLNSSRKINLKSSLALPKKQFIKKTLQDGYGKIIVVMNKPLVDPKLDFKDFNAPLFSRIQHRSGSDSLVLWYYGIVMRSRTEDSDSIFFLVTDKEFQDTVQMRLISKERYLKSTKGEKFGFRFEAVTSQPVDIYNPFIIRSNHPFPPEEGFNNSYVLRNGKNEVPKKAHPVSGNFLGGAKDWNRFGTSHEGLPGGLMFKPDTVYSIHFDFAAEDDMFGLMNDSVTFTFKTRSERSYGNLKLKITDFKKNKSFLQLLNEKGQVVRFAEVGSAKTLEFMHLDPGEYKIRIVYDLNNSGKWDPGDYDTHLQPEKVIYFPGRATIRADWDVELEWKFKD
jgi:uncharacterized protein (DUF2141 family)